MWGANNCVRPANRRFLRARAPSFGGVAAVGAIPPGGPEGHTLMGEMEIPDELIDQLLGDYRGRSS
jgi:hypothetical protein